MAYVKNTWVDQDVERPKTYEVTNNQDGSITLTDSFGLVTELGTPVNEVNMNHIENGIDGCAIRKHNLTETFNLGEWALGGTGDDEGIYKSLVSNNVGNAITDDTKWEKVEMVDISNKADVDGSNMDNSVKNFDGAWVGSLLTAFSNVTLSTTPRTVDLSSYLPNDGYDYLVGATILGKPNTAGIIAIVLGDYNTQIRTRGAVQNVNSESSGYIVVGNDRTVQCSTMTGTWTSAELRFFAYRRIGTNQ